MWDYPIPSDDVGISYQEYHGRGPEKGWWVNTVCWEAYIVTSGIATVYIDDQVFNIKKGDVIVEE